MNTEVVRIRDIADRAGVSVGTVDRVIHRRGRVSAVTRDRILNLVQELQYQPKPSPRTFVADRLYRLIALLPDHAADPYWLGPLDGVEQAEQELRHYGIEVSKFIFNPNCPTSFREQADKIRHARADGILLVPVHSHETTACFQAWSEQSLPVVLINNQLPGHNPLCFVGQNSYQSGQLAGRIAHFGQPAGTILIAHLDDNAARSNHAAQKENGFRDYFRAIRRKAHRIIQAELHSRDHNSLCGLLENAMDSNKDLGTIYVTSSKSHLIASHLETLGRNDIHVIGYDLVPENIAHLRKGTIQFLINENAKGQGYWGIRQLARFLALKQEIPAVKYLPLDVITKENVDSYSGF